MLNCIITFMYLVFHQRAMATAPPWVETPQLVVAQPYLSSALDHHLRPLHSHHSHHSHCHSSCCYWTKSRHHWRVHVWGQVRGWCGRGGGVRVWGARVWCVRGGDVRVWGARGWCVRVWGVRV